MVKIIKKLPSVSRKSYYTAGKIIQLGKNVTLKTLNGRKGNNYSHTVCPRVLCSTILFSNVLRPIN